MNTPDTRRNKAIKEGRESKRERERVREEKFQHRKKKKNKRMNDLNCYQQSVQLINYR